MTLKKAEHLLKSHRLRRTDTRLDVLDLFLKKDTALAQRDIEETLGAIDRITLYRTLRTFEEKGLIHRAIDGSEKLRFALCSHECNPDEGHFDEHAHFHCLVCESTFCLDQVSTPSVKVPKGYRIESSHLVLKGTCEKCNK